MDLKIVIKYAALVAIAIPIGLFIGISAAKMFPMSAVVAAQNYIEAHEADYDRYVEEMRVVAEDWDAWAKLTYVLPLCKQEDDFGCYWNASVLGDGFGRSFVALKNGMIIFAPEVGEY